MYRVLATEARFLTGGFIALLLVGLLGGNWLISAILVLTGYIMWLCYRLQKLESWLARGTKTGEVYDDNGFLGIIIRRLYQQKKSYKERKRRTKDILHRLNQSISALPDATVLLNRNLEIEWCNEPARYLLNIHARFDRGQRIANLLRHPRFMQYLNAPQGKDVRHIGLRDQPEL